MLLYGHVDKQPPFTGWHEGLSPYTPVIRGDRLYGRGGADDGYSAFAAITAIRALQTHSLPHGRCVIIIEASEESGSPDLPFYMEHLASRIGAPNLVVCLDSGAGNYEQLWVTTSLRGIIVGKLAVSVTKEGVHSGDASGVVPGTFRVLRKVLDRLEDSDTGVVRLDALHVDIPAKVREQVGAAAKVLGRAGMVDCFPFLDGARPVQRGADEGEAAHLAELALNRWWRPQVAVVGADGLPPTASAGNVLRPSTTVSLSIRLPPTLPTAGVEEAIRAALCEDAPYGATCTFESGKLSMGCAAPPVAPWLEAAASEASMNHFGKDAMYMGEVRFSSVGFLPSPCAAAARPWEFQCNYLSRCCGTLASCGWDVLSCWDELNSLYILQMNFQGGSIPFMGSLMTQFPQAQFLIIGVLGPASNAHGPNEFLEIGFSSKLTSCVAHVLTRHCDAKVEASLAVGSASAGNKAQKLSAEAQASNFGRNPDGTKI